MIEKQTILYQQHLDHKAKMIPLALGLYLFNTPILSKSISVRKILSIFDTCHMGEIRVQES